MATSKTNNVVYVQRLLPATPQEVFDAWIDPDSLAAWMRPDEITSTSAELDVHVGGSYRIVMRSATAEYIHTGEYLEIHPYERLDFTWRASADWPQASIVTVELLPQQDGTQLELTHERLPDEESVANFQGGWQSVVEKFAMHLHAPAEAESNRR